MLDYVNTYYAVIGVLFPCAAITLVLRLIARRLTKASYGLDDALAVFAFLTSVGYTTVILTWLVQHGLGRPNKDLLPDHSLADIKRKHWFFLFLTSETYTFAIAFCKFALLAFYWRIFKYTGIRIPIQVLTALTLAWFILRLFMVNLQCIPIQTLWDPNIKNGHCNVKKPTFFFSTGVTHLLIEAALLVLPAIELGRMHLPLGQKIAVMLLFMFGALTCISSIMVAVTATGFNADSEELGLALAVHLTWSTAEVNLAVISASLPMLRPIFRKIIPGSFLTSHTEGDPVQSISFESRARRQSSARKNGRLNDRGNSAHGLVDDVEGNNQRVGTIEWDHGARTTLY